MKNSIIILSIITLCGQKLHSISLQNMLNEAKRCSERPHMRARARQLYEQITQMQPDNIWPEWAEAHSLLAWMDQIPAELNLNGALEHYQQIINNGDKVPRETLTASLLGSAAILFENRQYDSAFECYERLFDNNEPRVGRVTQEYSHSRYNYAELLFTRGYYDKAAYQYDTLVKLPRTMIDTYDLNGAKTGLAKVKIALARMHLNGTGMPQDPVTAERLYREVLNGRQDHAYDTNQIEEAAHHVEVIKASRILTSMTA